MSDQFLHVPLAEIIASLTNPRTSSGLDQASLAELAEDIKRRGVDSPILLRPLPGARAPDTDRDVCYEIVAGERRYRASLLAGVATIPARVRELSDEQALESQLAENMHRNDISALEEAAGFDQLMRVAGISADAVAERIQKSRRHVYNRLKLLDLCIEAKDALRTGLIDHSRGILIARIPDNKLQLKALKEATTTGWQGELPSVRDLSDWIRKNVMLDLDHAVFKITDARLVEAAGSCTDCPKRTGANPDLFHDVDGADICTDPGCFHGKADAHRAQLVKKAEARGLRIVEGAEALELMEGRKYMAMPTGYLSLTEKRPDLSEAGDRPTTLAQALGKDAPAPILFIHPRTQEAMELVPEEEAEAVLLAKGLIKPEDTRSDAATNARSLEDQLQYIKDEIARETERTAHAQLYAATLQAILQAPAPKAKQLLTGEVLRAWLLAELDVSDTEDMAENIGLQLKDGDDEMDAVTQRIQRLGDTELLRAVAATMLRADNYYNRAVTTPVLDALVQTLQVDAKSIKLVAAKSVKAQHAAEIKAIQDQIDAQKPAPAHVPAAQAPKGAGAKPKTSKPTPARAAKTTAEEAQRGIATAMQGLEASDDAETSPTDPLYLKARALVIKEQRASKGLLKDHLQIGQDKALALLDQLQADGVVSAAAERQARKVLVAA